MFASFMDQQGLFFFHDMNPKRNNSIEVTSTWNESVIGVQWHDVEGQSKWHRSAAEVSRKWVWSDMKSGWHRSESKDKSTWFRSEMEVDSKWNRSELAVKREWARSDIEHGNRGEIEVNSTSGRSDLEKAPGSIRSDFVAEPMWHTVQWDRSELRAEAKWNRLDSEVKSERKRHWIEMKPATLDRH